MTNTIFPIPHDGSKTKTTPFATKNHLQIQSATHTQKTKTIGAFSSISVQQPPGHKRTKRWLFLLTFLFICGSLCMTALSGIVVTGVFAPPCKQFNKFHCRGQKDVSILLILLKSWCQTCQKITKMKTRQFFSKCL